MRYTPKEGERLGLDIEQGPDGRYTVAIMGNGLAPKVTVGPLSSDQLADLRESALETWPADMEDEDEWGGGYYDDVAADFPPLPWEGVYVAGGDF